MNNKDPKKKSPAKMTVFGTAPVSSRGQIVIPAKLRKVQNINPGDTLIFTGSPESGHFNVLNANSFKGFTDDLNKLVFNNHLDKSVPQEEKPKQTKKKK